MQPLELKRLQQYQRWRAAPPTYGKSIVRAVVVCLLFLTPYFLWHIWREPSGGLWNDFTMGFMIGASTIFVVGTARGVKRWSLTERILDWDHINHLVSSGTDSQQYGSEGA
jgi:hypothetical protein